MDSSHFFSDCLDFDDPNSYQSPDHDAEGGAIMLHPFNPYGGKLDFGGTPTPADGRDLETRVEVWDGFTEQMGAMATADPRPLFVDPGLYSPDSSESDDTQAQIHVIPIGLSRSSTRRTSSSKSYSRRTSKSGRSSTDITPPEQDSLPKKRKTRKIKRESNTGDDEQKRNKFLERNRIAASKCREKKKLYVSELEETKIGLEAQHAHLQIEYNALIGEISGLKHHLMAHAKCNDPNIDRWLNNEARKFVETSNEIFGQFTPFGPGQPPPLTGSPRSRNDSIASSYPSMHSMQFDGLGSGERQGSIAYSHGELQIL
jgi:cyclic AMP-dependent transcription factor ATF-2